MLPDWPQHANNLRKIKRIRKDLLRLMRELGEVAEMYDCSHHVSYYQSPIDVTYAVQRQVTKAKQETVNSPLPHRMEGR